MRKALERLRQPVAAFASQLSGLDEFYVVLDEPHRTWAPGDTITGAVILDLPKPVQTSQVRLRLLGQLTVRNPLVKGPSFRHVLCHEELVLWDASDPDLTSASNIDHHHDSSRPEDPSLDSDDVDLEAEVTALTIRDSTDITDITATTDISDTRYSTDQHVTQQSLKSTPGRRRDRILASVRRRSSPSTSSSETCSRSNSASSTISSSSTVSCAPAQVRRLPRGEHTFAFMFELPSKGLMTSLKFEKGSIVYMLTATHHRPGPFPPLTAHKVLNIQCPLDVADLPPPKPSMLSVEIKKKKKTRSNNGSGTASAIVEVPTVGCLRGETIPVKITVRHVRDIQNATGAVVTFLRISRVCAHDLEPLSFRKDLVQVVSPLYIDSRSLITSFTANIQVPSDIFPTIDEYPLVAFKYCLEVVLDLSGKADLPLSPNALHAAADSPVGESLASRPYVDTELLKRTKGVVCLWTEVVVGTERSPQVDNNPPASPRRTRPTPQSSTEVQVLESFPTVASSTPSSFAAASSPARLESNSPSLVAVPHNATDQPPITAYSELAESSSGPMRQQLQQQENNLPPPPELYPPSLFDPSETEKERLAKLEAALLPSAPPLSEQSLTNPMVPTADILEVSASASSSGQFISSEISAGESSPIADQHTSSDKLESERQRLLQMQSEPSGGRSESFDAAPVYSASAPARNAVEVYSDLTDATTGPQAELESGPHRQSLNEEDEDDTDWVPVYSANAREEFVSMGGYAYPMSGYVNSATPYEYATRQDEENENGNPDSESSHFGESRTS
ncbi:uncharacterized protein V1516DRAFT_672133 [Lipomyces oligophaga]|uniref:uncharacterized protein n=1 Tax=Lipomyces oligophaga TaxID=45792 RepID=UPI0034CF192C